MIGAVVDYWGVGASPERNRPTKPSRSYYNCFPRKRMIILMTFINFNFSFREKSKMAQGSILLHQSLVTRNHKCYFEMWPNICKNQNVPHGGPERPPVPNPNSILTNINIGN